MNNTKRFQNHISKFCILFVTFSLVFISNFVEAFDLDKYGPQPINDKFIARLHDHPNALRAVFLDTSFASDPLILYVCASGKSNNKVTCRMQLPLDAINVLKETVVKFPLVRFKQKNVANKLFYSHGLCHSGFLLIKDGCQIRLKFVPLNIRQGKNNAFIGDFGFLTWECQFPRTAEVLKEVILSPFRKKMVMIAKEVQWNRYYTFRNNYYGLVHKLKNPGLDLSAYSTWEPIIHKLTVNKRIRNHEKKIKADMQIFYSFFKYGTGMLSQRERARRKFVPEHVRLQWSRIKKTDIGTGNNQFIFMSLGSGINYFDDPWKQPRKNIPNPRLLFYPEILNLENIQIYPTFSIEPKEDGAKRLGKINEFQFQSDSFVFNVCDRVVAMPITKRAKVVDLLIDNLCRYGILNNSDALRNGFYLQNQFFKGNIINNEVRISDFLYPEEWLMNVIVPPGTKKLYLDEIKKINNNQKSIIIPRCKPWTEVIVEAPFATDKGFRMAYLELALKRTRPALWRLCQLSRGRQCTPRPGYSLLMNSINTIIKKTGISFFQTKYSKLFRRKYKKWQENLCEVLEASRNNNK